jgi:hypothetical protein
MATIVDKTACELAGQGQENGLLPATPFTALQFHFGMLLGVDDLETGQAYARGKMRMHNAWLHREGVVWGLNVAFNTRGELTVEPGLALDAAGHEIHLDHLACMDVGQWYAEHKDDPDFTFIDDGPGKKFTVHVVARFKACLTRPVPAIVEPCAGVENDTAYSRVFETVELLLRPKVSVPRDPGYHRVRVLFQLEPDSTAFADVKTERDTIQAMAPEKQPAAYLAALRRFAALDAIDLKPQAATASEPASIFPEDPADVVLADIADLRVRPASSGGWELISPPPTPVVTVRRSHIATATIQELLCGPLFKGGARTPTGPTVTDAQLVDDSITFRTSAPIVPSTLDAPAFWVSDYDDTDGWIVLKIDTVTEQPDGSITIKLKTKPEGTHLRLVIRGTGATPLLGAADHVPLGAPGAGGADDGTDFVKMFKRS